MADLADAVEYVLLNEGGDEPEDKPSDRGGLPRYGWTVTGLRDLFPTLPDEALRNMIRNLDRPGAAALYWRLAEKYHLDTISDGPLQTCLLDCIVLDGPGTAIKGLQAILGVTPDGIPGEQETQPAWRACDPVKTRLRLAEWARARRTAIVLKDVGVRPPLKMDPQTQLHNLRGWGDRARRMGRGFV